MSSIINTYVRCYYDAVDTEMSMPELFQAWDVSVCQGIHIMNTGKMILQGKVILN